MASLFAIVGSILSKKLCEGLRGLVMDIKLGSGALFQSMEDVETLANSLVSFILVCYMFHESQTSE